MNPEKIHDALNYLDDDLIEETDALRRGERVLRTGATARRVLRWVAPAACLVLVLGAAALTQPMTETGDTAQVGVGFDSEQSQSPGEALQDQNNYGTSESRHESVTGWQTVSGGGISLAIPESWTYTLDVETDSFFIIITPPGEEGSIRVGCQPSFGVCGTGLTEEETTIAGMRATMGSYDGSHVWSFITFPDLKECYVVLNEGGDQWWGAHGDTVMRILETLVIEDKG